MQALSFEQKEENFDNEDYEQLLKQLLEQRLAEAENQPQVQVEWEALQNRLLKKYRR